MFYSYTDVYLAKYIVYFPEFLKQVSAKSLDRIQTHNLCIARTDVLPLDLQVSYKQFKSSMLAVGTQWLNECFIYIMDQYIKLFLPFTPIKALYTLYFP